jgi:hypothetical protein
MPELKVLRAVDGFFAKVFLNGKQVHEVTEILASEKPNDPVEGLVVSLRKNSENHFFRENGLLLEFIAEGIVHWESF